MFDFTNNIKLNAHLQKRYSSARIVLHVLFVFLLIFVADRILFPSSPFDFSFDSVNSLKNTITNPRNTAALLPDKGNLNPNDTLTFDTNPFGHFSSADITFTTDKNSNLSNIDLNVRKSYQAFFYPLGAPMGFRDGTLVSAQGNYYIVSNGLLRKFASADLALQMGYAQNAFISASQSDLAYNKMGPDITNSNVYPDNTLFAVSDTYYELREQKLLPFISQRAFLSQFDQSQAITKDDSILTTYPLSDTYIGFADGTLASSDPSVFILSNGKSYPIINANTFMAMGFDWNNIIALSPDEVGLYDQQKQFNNTQPHPNGTLFQDAESKKYFVIENGTKRPIESAAVARTYAKQHPVVANLSGLEQKVSCALQKQTLNFLNPNTYTCTVPLDAFANLAGNDYQIQMALPNGARIKTINMTFFTPFTWQNLKDSLSNIKNSLKNNYVPAETQQ